VARRQAITLLAHPDLEIIDQRLCPLLADGNTFSGRLAVDAPLDLEQLVDPAHRFGSDRRLRQCCEIEEVPAAVAPARRFGNRRGLPPGIIETVKARERIGLHDAGVTGEMFAGMIAGAVA
jgi:hypothetical protein